MPPVSSDASKHGKKGNAIKHGKEGNAMTFQYFSENLVYYAPTANSDDVVSQPACECMEDVNIVAQTLGSNTAGTLWTSMDIRSSIHNSSRQMQTNITCHRQYHDIYSITPTLSCVGRNVF